MAWVLFSVPSGRRGELDAVLKDDLVSRQSQKVRDAAALGGPSDRVYVLVEGSVEGTRRAAELLASVTAPLPASDADPLFRRFKEEEEAASAGMGLFFTEG